MSLIRPNLMSVVKQQFSFKLQAYSQVFLSLIFIQLLGILFSFGGVGGSGTSSDEFELNIHFYSADIIIVFTMLWGFITAILITTKSYRNDDFTFVTNRMSSNLANFFFLLVISFLGGLTAILSTSLIKVILYYFVNWKHLDFHNLMLAPEHLFLAIAATTLYIFFFCAAGYLAGTLIQIHKSFAILMPILFVGVLFIGGLRGNTSITTIVYNFIFNESSYFLFSFKMLIMVILLFSSAFVMTNRKEVSY